MAEIFDLAVVGGGINGCGIARDAIGRGLSVYLCDKGDLGGATSSASTKLLHGGLRYLEHYEFRLVREALAEREVLWSIAPHIVRPMRFVLPHVAGMRPRWMLRTGLFLYDHLGGRAALPGTTTVDLDKGLLAQGLRPEFTRGWEYSDCWVEDNRLVVLNAQAARAGGAEIAPRTEARAIAVRDGLWSVETVDQTTGVSREIRARVLINAAGPWAGSVAARLAGRPPKGRVRMVQGSHVVVRRLYEHDRCFIFQNPDGRIVFTIPYEDDFTLIGTTDRDFDGDPARVRASKEEIAYLCAAVGAYFRRPVTSADVAWSYSGVRPLYDDGASAAQAATRDYVLELDRDGGAPMLSIFGGKITTYRRLAEEAVDRIAPCFADGLRERIAATAGWTGRVALPGGDFAPADFPALVAALADACPGLGRREATRLVRYYGTRAETIFGGGSVADLGRHFGHGLCERELDHMRAEEWAMTAEDVLWRRSKLGLHLDPAAIAAVDDYFGGSRRAA